MVRLFYGRKEVEVREQSQRMPEDARRRMQDVSTPDRVLFPFLFVTCLG